MDRPAPPPSLPPALDRRAFLGGAIATATVWTAWPAGLPRQLEADRRRQVAQLGAGGVGQRDLRRGEAQRSCGGAADRLAEGFLGGHGAAL